MKLWGISPFKNQNIDAKCKPGNNTGIINLILTS